MINALCERIDSGIGDLADAFVKAAQVFEKYRGVPPDISWDREIIDTNFTATEIVRLRSSVVGFIEAREDRAVAAAIWALGKLFDKNEKQFFIEQLERFRSGDGVALYQCLIALSNLGEDVFQGAGSSSMLDEEDNRSYARNFLQNKMGRRD